MNLLRDILCIDDSELTSAARALLALPFRIRFRRVSS